MNLEEISDEELVRGLVVKSKVMPYFTDEENEIQDILSRLARGRKAIETMERIEQHAYRPIREVNHSCDYMYAIDDIKQIIKEVTDDQG